MAWWAHGHAESRQLQDCPGSLRGRWEALCAGGGPGLLALVCRCVREGSWGRTPWGSALKPLQL